MVIVSRDADYGLTLNGKSYINDHLRHEFSERVSKKRGLYLYDSLARALKEHFQIPVTPQEEAAEKDIAAPVAEKSEKVDWIAKLAELFAHVDGTADVATQKGEAEGGDSTRR